MRRATYKITTDATNDNKAYVVSVSTENVAISPEMHELHQYLYEKGAPVVRPVGGIGHMETGHSFVVSEFLAGKSPSQEWINAQDMKAFGVALAKLHVLREEYFREKGIDPVHEAASWRAGAELLRYAEAAEKNELKKWLRDDVPIKRSIMQSVRELREIAYDMPERKLSSGLVHRDAHPGNMIIGSDGQVTLIDIETCGRGIPFQDVAVAMLWGGARPDKDENQVAIADIDTEKLAAFLQGYASVRPLSRDDQETILTLIKNQAKACATLSNMGGFNPAFKPDDCMKWSEDIRSWVDRVTSRKSGKIELG